MCEEECGTCATGVGIDTIQFGAGKHMQQAGLWSSMTRIGQRWPVILACVCADLRHCYIAAIYDNVSELWTSWLVG